MNLCGVDPSHPPGGVEWFIAKHNRLRSGHRREIAYATSPTHGTSPWTKLWIA